MATDDAVKVAEERGYHRGYNAGRKRIGKDLERWEQVHADIASATRRRRDQFFCAALTAILTSGRAWRIDGVEVTSPEQYAELARIFMRASLKGLP